MVIFYGADVHLTVENIYLLMEDDYIAIIKIPPILRNLLLCSTV